MICQTDLLPRLRKSGVRVGVLTADVTDASLVSLAAEIGLELYAYDVPRSTLKAQLFQLRRFFLNDIRHNPALMDKYMSRKLDPARSALQRLQTRLSKGLYLLGNGVPVLRRGYRKLEHRLLPSPAAEATLARIAPDWLICTYPVMNPEPEFLLAARKLGIPSVLHLLSWDNITSKGVFPALADRYVVWGDVMAEELQAHYSVKQTDIYRCGVPHFDAHVAARAGLDNEPTLRDIGLDASHPYLFVAMSAPRFCPREIDIVEWLATRVSEGDFGPNVQLVVRPHPQNVQGYMADLSWLPRIQALESLPRVGVLYPKMTKASGLMYSIDRADMYAFTHALAGAAVVINSGSTVSIDAMMTGRPVVLTSFDADAELDYWYSARRLKDYLHLAKLIRHGGVSVTNSFNELKATLDRYLAHPEHLAEKRRATVASYAVAADGRSTERAVDYYRALAAENAPNPAEA